MEDHVLLCWSPSPRTFWVEVAHVPGLQGIVGADLDLELQDGVWETLKEELVDGHVKGWDDFLRMVKKEKNKKKNLTINISMLLVSRWLY